MIKEYPFNFCYHMAAMMCGNNHPLKEDVQKIFNRHNAESGYSDTNVAAFISKFKEFYGVEPIIKDK